MPMDDVLAGKIAYLLSRLDNLRIASASDWNRFVNDSPLNERFELSLAALDLFDASVSHVNSQLEAAEPAQVRYTSSSLARQHLNLLACVSDDGVVVGADSLNDYTDGASHELDVNMPDVPATLIEAVCASRPLLSSGRALVVPRRLISHQGVFGAYPNIKETVLLLDDPFEASRAVFLTHGVQPEVSPARRGTVIPIARIRFPMLDRCGLDTLIDIIATEVDATIRFRHVVNRLLSTGKEPLSEVQLNNAFQEVDYQVRKLQLEYEALLRKREKSLAGVLLGTIGLTMSFVLPPELTDLGKAILGVASAAQGLEYVSSVPETKHEMLRSDYYLVWKAWRSKV